LSHVGCILRPTTNNNERGGGGHDLYFKPRVNSADAAADAAKNHPQECVDACRKASFRLVFCIVFFFIRKYRNYTL
jgi:hypothetical protein